MSVPLSEEEYAVACSDIHLQLGRAIDDWSLVEQHVHNIFVFVASSGLDFTPALSSVFWAVQSFEAKLMMTTAAIKNRSVYDQRNPMLDDWRPIRQQLKKKNQKRNKLAHGSIISPVAVPPGATAPVAPPAWVPFYNEIGYRLFKGQPKHAPNPDADAFEELSADDILHIRLEFAALSPKLLSFFNKHIWPSKKAGP